MLIFGCSACQKKLSIQEQHAGKTIKCPGCGAVIIAPKAEPPPAVLQAPAAGMPTTAESPAPAMPTPKAEGHDPALVNILSPPRAGDELGRLGKYRVLGIIGHGGMGIVYQAEDSLLKRKVALKAILPAFGANEQIHKRFLREARALAQLDHENVVRLYEVNEDRGVPYIAMEFLSGATLEARLRDGLLPLAEALRISREIAEGLAAAHKQNLIHRDIKPANVFLAGEAGQVKILDFGLARADAEESRLTASGAILGTPAYMSPEQSRGEQVDYRCDLFSLGVVLYRVCTGHEPFRGPDAVSTMLAITTETPIAPQVKNFEVSPDLSDLIMKLLDKQPAKRGTAQQAVEVLRCIERGEPAPAQDATPAPAAEIEDEGAAWREVTKGDAQQKVLPGKFPWLIVTAALAAMFLCVLVPLAVAAFFLLR
jgi:serine/threonine protein kinase/DNA-directed RNA polymerase subunit RPC12/RpoP